MKKEITFETIGSFLGMVSAAILIGGYIFDFFNEPNLIFLKPEQILLRNYKFDPSGVGYLRVATSMSYINEDNFGKNSIVTKESLSFSYYDKNILQTWTTFETFQEDEKQQLHSIKIDESGPFLVNSRSAITHNTYFAPAVINCVKDSNCNPAANFVKFDDFLEYLENSLKQQSNTSLRFTYEIEVQEDEKISNTCNVLIHSIQLQRLKQFGWVSLTCL